LRLVSAAGRGVFLATVTLLPFGLGMVALLLVGSSLLHELSHGAQAASSMRVWWLLIAAVGVAGIVSFRNSPPPDARLLAEQTVRYCNEVMLGAATNASLRNSTRPNSTIGCSAP